MASVLALVMCGGDEDAPIPGGAGGSGSEAGASETGIGADGGPRAGDADLDGGPGQGKVQAKLAFFEMLPGAFQTGFGEAPPIAPVPGGGFVVALPVAANVTIGSEAIPSNGRTVALVKVDAKGKPVWARALQPNDETRSRDLAVDAAGNVYFVGHTFATTMDFGNGKTLASPTGDSKKSWGFVAKLDATGTTQWAQSMTSNGGFLHLQVAAHESAVIVTGTSSLGGVRYKTASGSVLAPAFMGYESKVFALSLSPADGLATWFEQMSAPSGATASSLVVLPSKEIVLTGTFRDGSLESDDPATFAPSPGGAYNAFVTKLSATGVHAWTRAFGAKQTQTFGVALAADGSGRLIAAGSFDGSVDFGKGARTGSTWVVSLDPATGATGWDKPLPTGVPVGLALDAKGGVALSFDMLKAAPAASVDGVAFPTSQQAFLAGLDATGTARWVHAATGAVPTFSGRMASGGGLVVEYNTFKGTADFGGGSVASRDGGATATAYLLGLEAP